MKSGIIKYFALSALLLIPFLNAEADGLPDRLRGKILLQVEDAGQAWYVEPETKQRAFLGRPSDAFRIMRELGLGVSEQTYNSFNGYAPDKLGGKILLRVEANGEAYYVNPDDNKMHYLGRPSDAFGLMRSKGLGITNNDLNEVPVFQKYKEQVESNTEAIKELEEKISEQEQIIKDLNINKEPDTSEDSNQQSASDTITQNDAPESNDENQTDSKINNENNESTQNENVASSFDVQISQPEIIVNSGDTATIKVEVKNAYGNIIPDKLVYFEIREDKLSSISDDNGVATHTYTPTNQIGEYKIIISADNIKATKYIYEIAPPKPTISLQASNENIDLGENSKITWQTENASTCVGSGFNSDWKGEKDINGSQEFKFTTPGENTLILECENEYGDSVQETIDVHVKWIAFVYSEDSGESFYGGTTYIGQFEIRNIISDITVESVSYDVVSNVIGDVEIRVYNTEEDINNTNSCELTKEQPTCNMESQVNKAIREGESLMLHFEVTYNSGDYASYLQIDSLQIEYPEKQYEQEIRYLDDSILISN